jgi:predicted DCC family thiol-disulfide oxidoreductase YuxK
MTKLTVLYDYRCGLCQRARRWMEAQPKFLPLEFIPAGSDHARERFPALPAVAPDAVDELIVVGDDGSIYKNDRAWILCLWALQDYREWADRLATPRLLPLARTAFQLISENRIAISRLFRLNNEEGVAHELTRQRIGVAACAAPPAPPRSLGAAALRPAFATGVSTNSIKEWLE